ncbi:hypothetical protein WJX79_011097 [Trebouxia sp. C0005]
MLDPRQQVTGLNGGPLSHLLWRSNAGTKALAVVSCLTSHEHIKWEHALIQMVKRKRGNISTIDKVDVDLSRTSCDPKCSNVRS